MLEDLGHTVVTASSAPQALHAFDESPGIEVLISDQAMPAMTGLQRIAAIRSRRPCLATILATGYAELPDGADESIGRLSKPYTQQELKSVLERVRIVR